jgi:hypothetical protein
LEAGKLKEKCAVPCKKPPMGIKNKREGKTFNRSRCEGSILKKQKRPIAQPLMLKN